MRERFRRLSLATQFWLLGTLILVSGAIVAFFLVGRIYIADAHSRARVVADMVEDMGTWASKYRGVWVRGDSPDVARVGDALATVPIFATGTVFRSPPDLESMSTQDASETVSTKSAGALGGFHLKNPELVQREISEVAMAAGHGVKFRVTSDKLMRPASPPTRFELAALESMRESGRIETSEIKGGRLLYARRLNASAACLSCHDTPANAPAGIRARYRDREHSYGYKVGDLVGIVSVSVPVVEPGAQLFSAIGGVAWLAVGLFMALFATMLWFVQRLVIAPVQRLSRSAAQASEADIADIRPADLRLTQDGSRNDIHLLDVAIKRLLRSLVVQRKF